MHAADADTLDQKYIDKIKTMQHEHLAVSPGSQEVQPLHSLCATYAPSALCVCSHARVTCGQFQFTVEHYAGSVTYDAKGFPAKNKDTLFVSLVMCMQESASSFVHGLFPGLSFYSLCVVCVVCRVSRVSCVSCRGLTRVRV